MKDADKTKGQLLAEAKSLRRQASHLKKTKADQSTKGTLKNALTKSQQGIAEHKQTKNALRERLKELNCLYKVDMELQQGLEDDNLCQRVIEHIVTAMQFPDITAVLMVLDNKQCASEKYSRELSHGLQAEIRAGKEVRGHLYVFYIEQRPFIMPHEQNLVTGIAQSLGLWLERKQIEEALKDSETKFRSLVESTSDWIWEINKDGIYTYVSPKVKDLIGYEPAEVVGKTPFDFMPPQEAERIATTFKGITAASKPIENLENTLRHKDGHLVTLETSGVPIFDSKGNLRGYRGIDRDVTERKKMTDSFIITDRLAALGSMAGGFAHELNNPLTGVIGYAQLLLDRKELPSDIRKDLEGIYTEAQRAAEVIRDFMRFALQQPKPKQPVDINDLIKDVLKLRRHAQSKNNITIKSNFAPDLPLITVGPVRMRQVFMDIIINAEYFMFEAHKKGTLTITTEKVGDFVRASFVDDGPGIPPEHLGQIFNPFFTTKEVGKGIGLGLSICHSIVSEHGGRIYVESEPGIGANFTVELPINQ